MSDYRVSRINFEINNNQSEYPSANYQFINGNYEPIV
jgi:hypothetical protein